MELAADTGRNLTDEDATRRLRGGIVMLAVALMGAAILEKTGASPYLRLALFVPFFFAEYSFFQAIYRTCGFQALKGMRSTPEGPEPIADPQARNACRCAGKAQIVHSFLAASALTALFVFLA